MKKQIKKFNDNKPQQRDYFLDFLKMICILFVIIHHLFYYIYWTKADSSFNGENFGFQFYIYQAVPIFMVISGYVWAQSYERAKCKNIGDCYKPYFLLRKFTRLFIPFVVYYLMCLTVALSVPLTNFSHGNWIQYFFTGGPIENNVPTSAYYVVLLFSMIIIMPLIWIIVKKLGIWGFSICYLFDIIFEIVIWILTRSFGKDSVSFPYQFIIFRYTPLLAYGIYLAYHKDQKPIIWLLPIAAAIGATGLSLYYYGPIAKTLQNKTVWWGWSNVTTFPFTIAIMAILVRYCHFKHKAWGFIGNKTWSIFLAQTFVFAYTLWVGKEIRVGHSSYTSISPFVFSNNVNTQIWITIGLIAAISVGMYVLIEWLATGNLMKLMEKKHKTWLANRK